MPGASGALGRVVATATPLVEKIEAIAVRIYGASGVDVLPAAAKALKRANADITLIDRTNHFTFQPLLYQVATAALSPADIAMRCS